MLGELLLQGGLPITSSRGASGARLRLLEGALTKLASLAWFNAFTGGFGALPKVCHLPGEEDPLAR